jgi:hypothetical protein
MKITRTRLSLPERLRQAGCPGEYVHIPDQGGRMVVRMPDGEEITPGEAAKRYGVPII